MTFDGDAPVGRVAFDNIGDLIDSVPATPREVRAVKFEVDARQVDHDTATSLAGFDVALSQLFDQRPILFNLYALLVERLLLFFLLVFLALKLIADERAGA